MLRRAIPADRNATLLGLLLLCSARRALGWSTVLADLVYPDGGKPALPGAGDFSISHGGDCVGCAVVADSPVGFDVEPAGRLTPQALRLIASAGERARVEAGELTATAMAVAKEAAVKALGGRYTQLSDVALGRDEASFAGTALYLEWPQLAPGHVAVLAHAVRRPAAAPVYVPAHELLGSWSSTR